MEVVSKSPNDVRTFTYQEYQENWQSIGQRYGTVERVKYWMENQQEFAYAVISANRLIWEAAKQTEIGAYIKQFERNRLHDYGYTADDLQRIRPRDAEKAVKHGPVLISVDMPAVSWYT